MDIGEAIVPLIVIIIFALSGLKKLLQSVAEQAQEGRGEDSGEYVASPSDLQDFLRGLEQARREQGGAAAQAGAGQGRAAEGAPQRRRRPQEGAARARGGGRQAAARRAERSLEVQQGATAFWEQTEAEETPPPPTEKKREEKPKPAVRAEAAAARKAEPSRERPELPALTPEGLKSADLRQAVIWSEILGPPVSKRPRPGHVPPTGPESAGA